MQHISRVKNWVKRLGVNDQNYIAKSRALPSIRAVKVYTAKGFARQTA